MLEEVRVRQGQGSVLQGDVTISADLLRTLFPDSPSLVELALKVSSNQEGDLSFSDITVLLSKIAENNANVLVALLRDTSEPSKKGLTEFLVRLKELQNKNEPKVLIEQKRQASRIINNFFTHLLSGVDNCQYLIQLGIQFYQNEKYNQLDGAKSAILKSKIDLGRAESFLQTLENEHGKNSLVASFIERLREFAGIKKENGAKNKENPLDETTVIKIQNNTPDGDIHSRYRAMLQKYPSGPDKEKMDKIKVTSDGKVEMMKRKFSVLQPKNKTEDIANGIVRGDASQGMGDMWYFSGKGAEAECVRQGMKLFDNDVVANTFIDNFPGGTEKERIWNFASLFFGNDASGKPRKAGYWNPGNEKWDDVGSYGYATLSKVNGNDKVYGAYWNDDDADMEWNGQKYPVPVVASEDC